MKILNLYAGIGGNRKHWDGKKHDITAVEINEEIAEEYQRHYPEDEVIISDAHQYLKENYQEYDFIWSSPPCPTHSSIRKAGVGNGQYLAKYPDMSLWQEIFFLDQYFTGGWVVENVKPYYDKNVEWELVEPQEVSRHYIWSNFTAPEVNLPVQPLNTSNNGELEDWLGFKVKPRKEWESVEKRKVLRNCVHPKIGEAILKARNTKQAKLPIK